MIFIFILSVSLHLCIRNGQCIMNYMPVVINIHIFGIFKVQIHSYYFSYHLFTLHKFLYINFYAYTMYNIYPKYLYVKSHSIRTLCTNVLHWIFQLFVFFAWFQYLCWFVIQFHKVDWGLFSNHPCCSCDTPLVRSMNMERTILVSC